MLPSGMDPTRQQGRRIHWHAQAVDMRYYSTCAQSAPSLLNNTGILIFYFNRKVFSVETQPDRAFCHRTDIPKL